ncbi:GNAT family N-acetyltransferase [Kitasatospora sp. NPDC048540]|uniref:GNAT family N-acetyltransferase n=1 Tax=unclassified Kitasatospora TaxID=2633591 RepID=UPI00068AFB9D|nr:GNAT family N-acetyltransferase [Kitasatospora sp. MBT63]
MSRTADTPPRDPGPPPSAAVTDGRPPELIALDGVVSLRRRREADGPAVNEAVRANLAHLRPWMPWAQEPPNLQHSIEMCRAGEEVWDQGTDFMYLVGLDARPGSVVGAFGLHGRIGPGALEIGYWVDVDHVGRGIATAAARALTGAALALPGIERVEIHCDESNTASAAVPRKLGYRLDRVRDAEITAPSETGRNLVWIMER